MNYFYVVGRNGYKMTNSYEALSFSFPISLYLLIFDLIISQMYSPAAVSWLLVLLTLDKNFFFKVGFDV